MQLNDDIHNYYEKLVIDYVNLNELDKKYSYEFLSDLCCIVLNQLPSKYIRHEVDMAFYLPQSERVEMEEKVKAAIEESKKLISMRGNIEQA